jgi:hypothetical protein
MLEFALSALALLALGGVWGLVHHSGSPSGRTERFFTGALYLGVPLESVAVAVFGALPPKWAASGLVTHAVMTLALVILGWRLYRRRLRFGPCAPVWPLVFGLGSPFVPPLLATYVQGSLIFASLPVTREREPLPCSSANSRILVAHIGDVHVSTEPTLPDGSRPGQEDLAAMLELVRDRHSSYVVVSGDLTDTGAAAEWGELGRILSAVRDQTRIVLVPGNHDYGHTHRADAGDAIVLGTREHRALLLGYYLTLQAELFGAMRLADGRTVDQTVNLAPPLPGPEDVRFVQRLRYCQRHCAARSQHGRAAALLSKPGLLSSADACEAACIGPRDEYDRVRARYVRAAGYWLEQDRRVFPLSVLDAQRKLAVLVLDTTPRDAGDRSLSGFGLLEPTQLDRLRAGIRNLIPRVATLVVAGHHAFSRRARDRFEPPENVLADPAVAFYSSDGWFYARLEEEADRARALFGLLTESARAHPSTQLLLMHGHRHDVAYGTYGDNGHPWRVLEAPNVAAEPDTSGLFLVSVPAGASARVHFCHRDRPNPHSTAGAPAR